MKLKQLSDGELSEIDRGSDCCLSLENVVCPVFVLWGNEAYLCRAVIA